MYNFLFDKAPVSLWEEDYSGIVKLLHSLSDGEKANLPQYFAENESQLEKFKSALIVRNVNSESLNLLEADSKQVLLEHIKNVFTGSSSASFISEMTHILQGVHDYDFKTEIMTLKGNRRYTKFCVHIRQDDDGTIVYNSVIVAIIDLTNRRASELALQDEKSRTQHYLNLANVLFASFDRAGRIIMLNRKMLDLLNIDSTQACGQKWIDNFVPADEQSKVQHIFDDLLGGKSYQDNPIEGQILETSGTVHTIEWMYDVLKNESGEIVEIIASGKDVSRERNLEHTNLEMQTQLQQSQKLNSISVLARGVAHEINNPLTGLLNYANILEEEIEDPELRDFAQGIQKEGTRVANIVSNLLTFARMDTGGKSVTTIREIIDRATMLISQSLLTDNIQLEIAPFDESLKTHCKIQDIQQVIINIFTNSWAAVNLKNYADNIVKRISTHVSSVSIDEKEYIRIVIEDNGVGIKKKDIPFVFDPFFSVQSPVRHAGMGLAVAYGIMADHLGRISIQSVYGEGTSVTVDLLSHTAGDSAAMERL